MHNIHIESLYILVNIDDNAIAFCFFIRYTYITTMERSDIMKQALNATDIKRTNQRLILDAIFHAGTTSRVQLARELQLSKPAISDNVQNLLDLGIVEEIGQGNVGPSGGRKSILLRFNPRHAYIIAVNLNFSNPVFVLSDLNGDVVQSFDTTFAPDLPVEACRDQILDSIRSLLDTNDIHEGHIYCLAVAAPGVFNDQSELIYYSTSCGGTPWWQINLKQVLMEAFSIPVIIYNDVKAAALGEWTCGAGEQEQNLFYLGTGLGIGSGIILNGRLLTGENYSAGEIYDYVDPLDVRCNRKLEDAVCIPYLLDQCRNRVHSPFAGKKHLLLEDIIQAYHEGNDFVLGLVEEVCGRLAILCRNYMTFISVNHVIFGGEYLPFGESFARQLAALYEGTRWPEPAVRMSVLGKYAGIQGMVLLAREQYFQELCF